MAFYDLPKNERDELVRKIHVKIHSGFHSNNIKEIVHYFDDNDTYIRRTAYLSVGRIFLSDIKLRKKIINFLEEFLELESSRIRQTAVNAAGEIGKTDFEKVKHIFDAGLFDEHHSPRNAVIGSVKKMSEVNPKPVLKWAAKYLHHEDKEIRRVICHGIELRGRKFPKDILPLLKELQYDKTARVRNTLIHVLGQIAYKKGCLETVIIDLKKWENKQLVKEAIEEILDVHKRYKDFSYYSFHEAEAYVSKNLHLNIESGKK